MNRQDILLIYEYNYWANRQILAAAAQVSLEQFLTSSGDSHSNLRGTLVHTFDAECGWRMLCQHGTVTFDMNPTLFPTVELLVQQWGVEEGAMRDYLAGLSDDDLRGIVRYTTDTGIKRARVLWHCLLHVVNHGTQHRSEAATRLTALGHSPGELDFTVFLNEWGG